MDTQGQRFSNILAPRIESGTLLSAPDVAEKIENMMATQEGTIRSVAGPCPMVWEPNEGGAIPYQFERMHGVHHASLKGGQQSIYLVHSGTSILAYRAATKDWIVLIGRLADSPIITANIPNDTKPRVPTQFITTPNGVVILPQDCRPYFFDGELVSQLGFDRAPGAPFGRGPSSSSRTDNIDDAVDTPGINDVSYAHDGQGYASTAMHPAFGTGKLGTVEPFTGVLLGDTPAKNSENTVAGQLRRSQYRAATQFIDIWGNLSPLSGKSAPVKFDQQQSRFYYSGTDDGGPKWESGRLEQVQKQISWSRIDTGPVPCIGRILYRTRDELNSGTADLFELPCNAQDGAFAFATVCDNSTDFYPDNVSDALLIRHAPRIRAIEAFSLAALWDGRLWTGRYLNDPGRVDCSLNGLWGTYGAETAFYPDAKGNGITGIHATSIGLLLFTEQSVFLVRRAVDSFNGYRRDQLSSTVGCAAPASIVSLPSGAVIWVARDGFYWFTGDRIEKVPGQSEDAGPLDYLWRRVTTGRLIQACACYDPRSREYRCWISVDGDQDNNLCLTFNGTGWQRRTDEPAVAVCVTQDPRALILWAGRMKPEGETALPGVWVMDHEVVSFEPTTREAVIETAWLNGPTSDSVVSGMQVILWLREFGKTSLTVEIMRDWRAEVVSTISDTGQGVDGGVGQIPWNYNDATTPSFWGVDSYDGVADGSTPETAWRRKRLFWRRVSFSVPSCEVYKVRIRGTRWEFMGLQANVNPKEPGFGRVIP